MKEWVLDILVIAMLIVGIYYIRQIFKVAFHRDAPKNPLRMNSMRITPAFRAVAIQSLTRALISVVILICLFILFALARTHL